MEKGGWEGLAKMLRYIQWAVHDTGMFLTETLKGRIRR